MRVIVAGGRDFQPTEEHSIWLKEKLLELKAAEIVCGMAKGADLFGFKIAKEMKLPIKEFPANWNKYGNLAGPIRNSEMAKNADACILFPGGKGTANMKTLAQLNELIIVEY